MRIPRHIAPALVKFFSEQLWPFGVFIDASSDDPLARAAAYRHNRRMRALLPRYLLNWTFGSVIALALTSHFEALASDTGHTRRIFDLAAKGFGTVFTAAACVTAIIAFVYLYLGRRDG
jgi:hypothetical protein